MMLALPFADDLAGLPDDCFEWWLETFDAVELKHDEQSQCNSRCPRPSPVRQSAHSVLNTPLMKPSLLPASPPKETPKKRWLNIVDAECPSVATVAAHHGKKHKSVVWQAHADSDHIIDVTESRLAATQRAVSGRPSNVLDIDSRP